MENQNCDMCTMPNCISRNLSSKEDCLLDKKLSANDSFDFLEQSLAKFAIDFAYKGKTLKECLDKYKSNIIAAAHTIEPTIPEIVDEHWWEMLGEEPVSEELEEAANNCYYRNHAYARESFIEGANWQKQKNESKVLTEEQCRKIRDDAFELGKDAMKQQMMKDAIEAIIPIHGQIWVDNKTEYKGGDKVKLIIIKKDSW